MQNSFFHRFKKVPRRNILAEIFIPVMIVVVISVVGYIYLII